MRKRSLILFAFLVVAASLSGCSQSKDVLTSDNPKVTVVEKTDTEFAQYEWSPVDEVSAAKNADLIAKGKVLSTKEVCIDFVKDGARYTEYKTLLEFSVSKLFYSKGDSTNSGDKISVILPISSYNWEQMAFEMNEGKEYIIFVSNIKGIQNDPMKLGNLASYAIKNPCNYIIEVNNSEYEFSSIFKSLKNGAERKDKVLEITVSNLNESVNNYGYIKSKETKSSSIKKGNDKGLIKGKKFKDAKTYMQKLQNTFVRKDKKFEDDLNALINKSKK